MSDTTATTVTPTDAAVTPLPAVDATVTPAAPVATEVAPAATPTESPVAPSPAETSVTQEPPATGAASEVTTEKPLETAASDGEVTPEVTTPTYTDFTFPEGAKVDAELVGQAKDVFGKHGLTQEVAQELIDLHTTSAQKALEAYQAQATDYWATKSQEWRKELQDDPQVGGNRFETSTELARAALSEGLNDADRKRLWNDLADTKIGDHPVLFKRMVQLGRERQQVLDATGTTKWSDAIKKIHEPEPPPPGQVVRGNGATRPADRRYQQRTTQ